MRWAHEHPEEMAEIAALPLSQQNEALRYAVAYDPDRYGWEICPCKECREIRESKSEDDDG